MIPVDLAQLASDCGGSLSVDQRTQATGEQPQVLGITSDSREVRPGDLFAAIRGEHFDGADLAGQAMERGAAGVLTNDPDRATRSGASLASLIVVTDVVAALGDLARANLVRAREVGNPLLKVLAVTGSVGKTTTKDLLAGILAERGPIVAPPGSFNNELGMPMTVLRVGAETATLIVEMGADHVGNIEYLTKIAPPDVACVLIVARAHVGEFGGIEKIAQAKSEIVTGTRPGGKIVLNADDVRVAAMARLAPGPVTTFSAQGNGDVYASGIHLDETGHAEFVLHNAEQSETVKLGLVGEHNVSNALAAAAMALAIGTDIRHIKAVLSGRGPASPHRMDVRSINGHTVIDDSYNANPDSMRAGIAGLARIGRNHRKIAVLGEMLELGSASETEHEALAPVLARAGVDAVVCLGNGTRPLVEAGKAVGLDIRFATSAHEALAYLTDIVEPGAVVLVKGSHGSGAWQIADALIEEEK